MFALRKPFHRRHAVSRGSYAARDRRSAGARISGRGSWAACRSPAKAPIVRSSESRATTTTGGTIASTGARTCRSARGSQLVDFHTFLPGLVLTKVDRTSMAVSLEARVPLLDRRIIEFSFALDEDLRYHNGMTKGLLRHAYRGILPGRHFGPAQEGLWNPSLLPQGRRRRPCDSGARVPQPVPRKVRNRRLAKRQLRAGRPATR